MKMWRMCVIVVYVEDASFYCIVLKVWRNLLLIYIYTYVSMYSCVSAVLICSGKMFIYYAMILWVYLFFCWTCEQMWTFYALWVFELLPSDPHKKNLNLILKNINCVDFLCVLYVHRTWLVYMYVRYKC